MKDNMGHFALLGIGAVGLLVYLMRGHAPAPAVVAPAAASAAPAGLPTYPAPAPIQLGDVVINEAPPYLTYNTTKTPAPMPSVKESGSGGCDCGGGCSGSAVTQTFVAAPSIPSKVLNRAAAGVAHFIKTGGRPVAPVRRGPRFSA